MTAGIISAEGRDIGDGPYDRFLQIDAPINRGNSGGPTFNMKRVVGVNTAIYSPSGGSVGIGFSIPSTTVDSVIGALEHGGMVPRGYLGVNIQPVTERNGRKHRSEEAPAGRSLTRLCRGRRPPRRASRLATSSPSSNGKAVKDA